MRSHSICFLAVTCLAALSACDSAGGDPAGAVAAPPAAPLPDEVTAALDLPESPYSYADVALPPHFNTGFVRDMDNTPADNPITDTGATLGRVLFHDTTLSANGTVACASCHLQEHAFADPVELSLGFEGGHTGRNSMSLIDARYYRNGRFFWDERAATLEDQVLMPIQDPVEMGLTLEQLVERVSAQDYYPYLFEQAFGDPEVTADRISRALAQLVRSMVSYRSRFDEALAAAGAIEAELPGFTAEENQGKDLFLGRAGCAACHLDSGPPGPGPRRNQAIFFIDRATNNGLDPAADIEDTGVFEVTGDPRDEGSFKSPSLRNVALTAPYMHDGRFATLELVVDHYNSGVQAHPNLDRRLAVPNSNPPEPRRLNLTPAESAALVAFLETLTDEALLADPKYADPFLHQDP